MLGVVRDITEHKRVEEERERTFQQVQRVLEGTVQAMAATVEMRDPYTAGHQQRVARLAVAIGGEMGLSEDQQTAIRTAALLHDIGKIAVPAEMLSKPSALSEPEFSIIKTHPQVSHDMLQSLEFPWEIARIAGQHHERLDGSGYPWGLSGPEILPEARILAVADVVEAMASHRPYRPALGVGVALSEIQEQRGGLYDADAVDACLRISLKESLASVEA